MVVKLNPSNLAGTLLLLLLLAALLPSMNVALNRISSNTTGLASTLALLILPMVIVSIIANFWEEEGR